MSAKLSIHLSVHTSLDHWFFHRLIEWTLPLGNFPHFPQPAQGH